MGVRMIADSVKENEGLPNGRGIVCRRGSKHTPYKRPTTPKMCRECAAKRFWAGIEVAEKCRKLLAAKHKREWRNWQTRWI